MDTLNKNVFIAKADESCIIAHHDCKDLPILHDLAGNIYEAHSDYLRFLLVDCGRSITTVCETAKVLSQLISLTHSHNRSWDEVHLDLLLKWRNKCVSESEFDSMKKTMNRKLIFIYQFLIWAQNRGYCHQVIGPFQINDRLDYQIPLSFKATDRSGMIVKYQYPLLYRTLRESDLRNASPDEIDSLYIHFSSLPNHELGLRYNLIARFAEESGLRIKEILGLKVEQLPPLEKVMQYLDDGRMITFPISITKGGKTRIGIFEPRLIIDTWGYINEVRSQMCLDKLLQRTGGPIFLSPLTARPLKANTVTKFFCKAQKTLNITNASMHHLRSIAITNFIRRIYAEQEAAGVLNPDTAGILLRTKEFAGHASETTTMRYIRLEQKRRLNLQSHHEEKLANLKRFKETEERLARREGALLN